MWGRTIGAVTLEDDRDYAAFQYEASFARSGIEISPIVMPLAPDVYAFPALPRPTFHGLPGLLADSLPDKFGNALIDAWLATQGRLPNSFNAVERLCYTGARGMGALEFSPQLGPRPRQTAHIQVDALVSLASEILTHRADFKTSFEAPKRQAALKHILQVGTSAGGARAKAIVAWNEKTNEVRSGQVKAGPGFGYWLLKFDGVSGNKDKELEDPKGYGTIEYAYSKMAAAAGIEMSECRLFEENGRRHFMTKRFDRLEGGEKLHMQSLGALAHFDYKTAGAYGYEQALLTIQQLGLPMTALEQQFRRMAFNVVARNQDDHVKNIAFLMDRRGEWSLSPAFDVTYSYNPSGEWTANHQMTISGKRDRFTKDDMYACARVANIKKARADSILRHVTEAVADWSGFADTAKVDEAMAREVQSNLRLDLPRS